MFCLVVKQVWYELVKCFYSDNADGLKELYSRAQGEVSIREALRELELWGAAAAFNLTGYSDSAGKELTIIKDWKELVNQVITKPRDKLLLQMYMHMQYY